VPAKINLNLNKRTGTWNAPTSNPDIGASQTCLLALAAGIHINLNFNFFIN